MKKRRLLFVVNDAAFFLSHRLPVALAAQKEGYEVHVATPESLASAKIKDAGLTFHSFPLSRSGKNPLKELISLFALGWLFFRLKPQLIHLVTIKPVLYGGLMARVLRVPAVVAAISGLGFLYIADSKSAGAWRTKLAYLYRMAFKQKKLKVIFQNPDDRQTILNMKACGSSQTVLIRGSGVDLKKYPYIPEPQNEFVVVMISRLLKDKGVFEYVNAAKQLQAQHLKINFKLIGDRDLNNPACVEQSFLEQWKQEAHVEILGYRSDIASLMSQANLVVLPSYREGLPKVLMEAAACGRAVITTDVPGCRDAIDPNISGLLVPVRDDKALATAIKRLFENFEYRQQLGIAGRRLAENEFRIEKIVAEHLQIYRELV